MRTISSAAGSKRLFLYCFLAYAAVYVGRKNYSACMPAMIAAGVLDKVSGGAAGTAFLAVYACGQLVNGILGDRIDPKYMISCGLFGAALCNVLMGLNSSAVLFSVIWGACGFFCSMLWSPVVRCMSQWIDDTHRSAAGAGISATLPIGAIASYLVCALFLKISNWRIVFFACAAVLTAAGLIFYIGMASLRGYIADTEAKKASALAESDGEAKASEASDDPKNEKKHHVNALFLIVSCGLLFAIGGILFNGVLKDGLDLWVPSFLSEYFTIDASIAAALTAVLPVINLCGAFAARFINDRVTHNELGACAVLFGVSLLSFVPLCLITAAGITSPIAAAAAVLLISVTSASMLGVNSMLLTFIPFRFAKIGRSSSVTGFLNACSYAAASLSGIVFGYISSGSGWAVTVFAFAATAALGVIVSAAGIRPWKKGRERIDRM